MKAFVDENTCISCGLCEGVCPEIFSLETGVSVAKEGIIENELEDATREACEGCPVSAISIEE
ncbi:MULTISPECIES: ferredoxin [Clostridium]|jgi:ferredoxin|uniref:Ferredoxin n=1 Tax=Clostridium sartagoforme AAU1 TaxID=1202534 RepID=R9CC33_9CLOT|nr:MULTISPECIES: ferredoxin [Clostridium]EOR26924.1 ferredoxin [Clostridium sartagoforme AAU1]KLE16139.1 ferredoxin [Clostridium sp. C8]